MNTLLVTVDALRADHLGCHGYKRDTTPVLDRFAERHTQFKRAFSNGTFTSSAIPPILTGSLRKDSSDPTVIERNLRIDEPNLPSVLRDSGVYTRGINSNLLLSVWYEEIAGFDDIDPFLPTNGEDREVGGPGGSTLKTLARRVVQTLGVESRARRLYSRSKDLEDLQATAYNDAAAVTDRVLSWLSEWDNGEFFLWVHYMDPHEPYGYFDSTALDAVTDRSTGGDLTPERAEAVSELARRDPDALTEDERELLIDLYDGYIRYFDAEFGRLLDSMRDIGLYDETQIVLTADHGEEFGEHGGYFHGNRPYDELLHVPLLIKSPVVGEGVRDDLVSHVDIAPTIADAYGLETPWADGVSLATDVGDRRVFAFGSDRPYFDVSAHPFAAVRETEWKYIHHASEPDELYHLSDDESEQRDVSADHPDVMDRLATVLSDHLTYVGDTSDQSVEDSLRTADDSVQRRLEELGYLE